MSNSHTSHHTPPPQQPHARTIPAHQGTQDIRKSLAEGASAAYNAMKWRPLTASHHLTCQPHRTSGAPSTEIPHQISTLFIPFTAPPLTSSLPKPDPRDMRGSSSVPCTKLQQIRTKPPKIFDFHQTRANKTTKQGKAKNEQNRQQTQQTPNLLGTPNNPPKTQPTPIFPSPTAYPTPSPTPPHFAKQSQS